MSGADFWSRRKARVAAEEAAEVKARDAALMAERDAAAEELTDAEILAELNLPDPDTLEQGADFSAFMARAVPERIRKRALRRLWRSNPVLACVDGLNDYDGDFTDTGSGIVATTYQVGKGMLAHVQEMARQAEAEAEAEAIEPDPQADLVAADEPAALGQESDETATTEVLAAPAPAEPQAAPARRRMTFTFDSEERATA
jgi:hypothetical protein